MQRGAGKGRVGGGKQGRRSLNDQGTGPVRKEPSQSPSALLPALSHGVLEKGAGWPDWLACPWGQREGPRPARGAARPSPPWPSPSPPASPGRECLVPAAPSPGPEGRAGWAASYPLLLPTSSPPRCEPEPPPPLPPLTHAAPGLARHRVWDGVRGWGCRAESGRAGAIWWPLGLCHLNHPAEELGPLAKEGTQLLGASGKRAAELWERDPFPSALPARHHSYRGE